ASLADIAFTLQAGRRELKHRLAFTANSLTSAIQQLRGWLEGGAVGVYVSPLDGVAPVLGDQAAIRALMAGGHLSTVAQLWAGGMSVDWTQQLLGGEQRKRVSLPGSVFDLRSYGPQDANVSQLANRNGQIKVSQALENEGEAAKNKLLQSVKEQTAPHAYLDALIKNISERQHLMTALIVYHQLNEAGFTFEERRNAAGKFGLYLQPIEASGDTAKQLLDLLERAQILAADEAGLRLTLPPEIRNSKQVEQLQSQQEIYLRAMPEHRSTFELLQVGLRRWTDDPHNAQAASASADTNALLVDMFATPSKFAFLNHLSAELSLEEHFVGRDNISVLTIGAGGFDFLSAVSALAPDNASIEYCVVSAWPQIAADIAELGEKRFPNVSFSSFAAQTPSALLERFSGGQFDIVIVHSQDPCAQMASDLRTNIA
ncbi:MAG: hypothetical protein P8Y36_11365, partial [Alphaproteobacteria bacterium]